jgi:DNA-binding response OmpR family regulator
MGATRTLRESSNERGGPLKRTILVVDDEPRILMLMEHTLRDLEDEDEDIEVLTATDGDEALDAIQAERPALVFLDIMMPSVDGFDVCNTVKNEWGMQDVYVAMLTSKGQEVDRQRGARVGADLYLTKPFDPDKVLEIARDVLGLPG